MAIAYQEDYLQKLISATFGSKWLVIRADMKLPTADPAAHMSVDVSFPDMSGGTPGFSVIALNTPLASLKPAPYRVTSASMQLPLRTAAGAGLTGFGVRGLTNGARGLLNTQLYIRINDALPRSPFRVRMHYFTDIGSGTGDIEVFNVATLKNMKATTLSGGFLPDELGTTVSLSSITTNTGDNDRTFDFTVHPDSLQVDPAVG